MPSEIVVIGFNRLTITQALIAAPEKIVLAAAEDTARIYGPILESVLRQEPGQPSYPLFWTSRRQKIAFFFTFGFGRGIPTRRTHALALAWRVVVQSIAGQVAAIGVVNPEPGRIFVTGRRQQGFHRITGWINERQIFATYKTLMTQEFVRTVGQRFTPA